MNAVASHAVGVVILVMLLLFVGIWTWAWLPYHKKNFAELARIPMLDQAPEQSDSTKVEMQEGNIR
jgi:cytochrome c oxidase cbb3-type subunit 4